MYFLFTKEVATIIEVRKEQQVVLLKSEARNCVFGLKISKRKIDIIKIKDVKGIVTYIGKRFIKFQPFKF
jgi:hypothetical protein